jgi:hypothetical protein
MLVFPNLNYAEPIKKPEHLTIEMLWLGTIDGKFEEPFEKSCY